MIKLERAAGLRECAALLLHREGLGPGVVEQHWIKHEAFDGADLIDLRA
jgi:hypothetical protein